MGPKSAKSAKYRVFCGYTCGKTRVYLEKARDVAGFLDFASDFAPDQLSDSGKLASFQNGAPNTLCFPWKFPETQSAGDPLVSFLVSGNPEQVEFFLPILRQAADQLSNKLSHAQHLDEVTWTTKNWHGLQTVSYTHLTLPTKA